MRDHSSTVRFSVCICHMDVEMVMKTYGRWILYSVSTPMSGTVLFLNQTVIWWRRRELNPRPQIRYRWFYMLSQLI